MHLCGWFAGTSKTWLYEHVKLPIGYRPDSQSYPKTFNQLTDVVVGDGDVADQHTHIDIDINLKVFPNSKVICNLLRLGYKHR